MSGIIIVLPYVVALADEEAHALSHASCGRGYKKNMCSNDAVQLDCFNEATNVCIRNPFDTTIGNPCCVPENWLIAVWVLTGLFSILIITFVSWYFCCYAGAYVGDPPCNNCDGCYCCDYTFTKCLSCCPGTVGSRARAVANAE